MSFTCSCAIKMLKVQRVGESLLVSFEGSHGFWHRLVVEVLQLDVLR